VEAVAEEVEEARAAAVEMRALPGRLAGRIWEGHTIREERGGCEEKSEGRPHRLDAERTPTRVREW